VCCLSRCADALKWSCEGGGGRLPGMLLDSDRIVLVTYYDSKTRICCLYALCRYCGNERSNMAEYSHF